MTTKSQTAQPLEAFANFGALLRYLKELQPAGISLARPIVERAEGVLSLDEMTRRNLELTDSLRATPDSATTGTLLAVDDRTQTPMGSRLLRQWILAPLANKPGIDERLDAVQAFANAPLARETMRRTGASRSSSGPATFPPCPSRPRPSTRSSGAVCCSSCPIRRRCCASSGGC